MEVNKVKLKLIEQYSYLINIIVAEFTCSEETIIKHPDIGTVKDGCKQIYSNECKKIISEILTSYYSIYNIDTLVEYKSILQSRLDNEYNYENDRTTEKIAKSWATTMTISRINSVINIVEQYKKDINT